MRYAITILLTLTLVLIGCSKKEGGGAAGLASGISTDEASGAPDEASSAPQQMVALRQASKALTSPQAAAPQPNRMIIRTAHMNLIVSDTSNVIDRVTQVIEGNGGHVNDSKIWRDGELLRATLVLKVPAERLTQTLSAVRRLAVRVQNESIGSQEVTQEYVDLESQLRNLEAAEVELRELMTAVRERTKRASDVLEIHNQITTIRAQIEQTKGRMRYLSTMSAYSTINLELVPDAIAKPVVEPGWQPLVIVKNAGRALVGTLQALASVTIWALVYFAPVVLLLCAAAALAWKIAIAVRRRAGAV